MGFWFVRVLRGWTPRAGVVGFCCWCPVLFPGPQSNGRSSALCCVSSGSPQIFVVGADQQRALAFWIPVHAPQTEIKGLCAHKKMLWGPSCVYLLSRGGASLIRRHRTFFECARLTTEVAVLACLLKCTLPHSYVWFCSTRGLVAVVVSCSLRQSVRRPNQTHDFVARPAGDGPCVVKRSVPHL